MLFTRLLVFVYFADNDKGMRRLLELRVNGCCGCSCVGAVIVCGFVVLDQVVCVCVCSSVRLFYLRLSITSTQTILKHLQQSLQQNTEKISKRENKTCTCPVIQ